MNDVTREKLASDFRVLIGDVQELLKATASQAGESLSDLRQRLGKKLEEGKKALGEQEEAWREKAEAARASAKACLLENPWAKLGIAAGVGLVLGFLMHRRE